LGTVAEAQKRRGIGRHNRVLLSGAYGNGNFGDWALLEALLETVRAVEGVDISVLTSGRAELPDRFQVSTLQSTSLRDRLRGLLWADTVIYGGGGLVNESPNAPLGLAPRLILNILLPRLLGRRVVVYNVGVEKVETARGRDCIRRLLPLADFLAVRDEQSRRRLADLGVPAPRVRVGADPVLSAANMLPVAQSGKEAGQFRVGVNLCLWANSQSSDEERAKFAAFLDALAAQIRALVGRTGCRLTGIVCVQGTPGDDMVALRGLQDRLGTNIPMEVTDVSQCSVEEMVGLLSGLDFFVATRFHAVLTAAMAGVPFFAISYSPKVGDLVRSLGLEESCFDPREEPVEKLGERFDKAWTRRAEGVQRAQEACQVLRRSLGLVQEELLGLLRSPAPRRRSLGGGVLQGLRISSILLAFIIRYLLYRAFQRPHRTRPIAETPWIMER
jgi:polysaccharide pyruvyl transferase WcaK-like protein